MVSKAFQVLSDSNKRAIFDQTGSDPDSRGGGGGGGGNGMASAFARGRPGNGGGGFGGAQEMSPEDLFNMFFGGQGGGFAAQTGGFGGGGTQFRTQFYGPGGRTTTGRPQARAQNGTESTGSVWLQVAPLLALLLFSFLTQIPAMFSNKVADPEYSFSSTPQFTVKRATSGMGVDYFVNAQQFSRHPLYEEELKKNPFLSFEPSAAPGTSAYRQELFENILKPKQLDTKRGAKIATSSAMKAFEKSVDTYYTRTLQHRVSSLLY